MAVEIDPYKLSSPRIYLVRMVVFLILVGFVALILYKQIALAFSRNPGLNSLIFFVLFVGIVLALRQVIRLFREVRWVNALPRGLENEVRQPILLCADRDAHRRTPGERGGAADADIARRARFDRQPARRGARHIALSHGLADLPRPARHILGPA